MAYWLLSLALAVWTLVDGRRRHLRPLPLGLWALGAALAWPITIPLWVATRPLRPGERRAGGRPWVALRAVALTWSTIMALAILAGCLSVATAAQPATEAGRAGYALGAAAAMLALAALWFFVMVALLLVGFFLRDPGKVEVG